MAPELIQTGIYKFCYNDDLVLFIHEGFNPALQSSFQWGPSN